MSESNMQSKNPYPQGVGIGSVPVLFSLRNVQPKIVGGIANSNTKTTSATQTDKPESGTSPISSTTGLPAESAKPAPSISKNNRPYNIVVGLLILALCLLVIRNSQGTKLSSKSEMAYSSILINPPEPKPVANSKVESTPLLILNANEHKPLELRSSEVAKSPNSSELFPDSRSVEKSNDVQERPVEGQLLIQAKPFLFPPLLPSSNSETQSETNPRMGDPRTGSVDVSKAPSQSEISLPRAALPEIVDTNAPSMTTRELINLHELGKQFSPQSTTVSGPILRGNVAQGVQANTVSNVVPAVVGRSSSAPVMSGLPYPPLPKEYPALTVHADEKNPPDSRQGVAGPMQDSMLIRQPSNRYPYMPQPSTTPIPYTPIAPIQNGNSVGYPPGN